VGDIRTGTAAGRGLLLATVLGSGVAFLDGTVVNVALPHIAASLDAGFTTMQWIVDGYLLTLSAFVLTGGAIGDLLGRRRVFVVGLVGFGVASAACGLAPNGVVLVTARLGQGVAAALLVPGSLALITASFADADRDRAIGTWSGLAGLASAAGPFLGGWLVDAVSWRWVFFMNLPMIAVAVWVTLRHVPESRAPADPARPCATRRDLDVLGAVLVAAALGLLVVALIETAMPVAVRVACAVLAGAVAVGFFVTEQRVRQPMLPLPLLRSRVFAAANGITFAVYGALGGAMFLLAVQLQTGLHYSALEAGASLVPMTVMLLLFSARVGALVPRVGARPLLTAGPVVAGAGLALLTRAVPGASYLSDVLPGVLVFSGGMCLVVAPITSTALGALPREHAGLASGVNNAVARIAGLLAVAILPALAGVRAGTTLPTHGYVVAMSVSAVVTATGGVLALLTLPRRPAARLAPDTVSA
jgi:EmrB/QacA subfamily drug resistance transporter